MELLDGGTSTAANPSHDFAAGGDYSATLTVTDNRGGTGSASTGTFHVTAPLPTAPVAAFTSSLQRADLHLHQHEHGCHRLVVGLR